ncbi:MAG: hypothetical protein K2F60_01255 [Oscillospiraceae bacterium]|nr:hypothetical protein [Oscillospiraceae bacterium]
MKNFRKIIAGLMAVATLTFSMTNISVSAVNTYGYYQSPAMIAGQWCKTPTVPIAGSLLEIYAGDFGVWFYGGNVGLDNRFVRSTSRTVDIEIWEEDKNGTDIKTRTQTAWFTVDNDGVYRVTNFGDQWVVYDGIVEYDNVAEVYMKLKVNTISGDTSKNIPTNALFYEYWIE